MRRAIHCVLGCMIAGLGASAHGQLIIHTPTSVLASSSLDDSTFDESNLIDAVITEASIDTSAIIISGSNTANFGDSWANATGGFQGVLVLDMGSTLSLNGLLYAQRTFNGSELDDYGNVSVWIETTDPGPATLALPGTLGAADAAFALLTDDNGSTLRRYDFTGSLLGRYAVLSFTNGEIFPGGHELRLFTVIPEPSTLSLGAILLLMSAGARSRARRTVVWRSPGLPEIGIVQRSLH